MHQAVQQVLEESEATFSLIKHADLVATLGREIRSPVDFAEAANCQPGQIVKTLLVSGRSPERLALVALPAVARLDLAGVARELSCSRVEMASPETLAMRLGYPRNGVSPIVGKECGDVALIADASLFHQPLLYIGSGTAGEEIAITPAELQRIMPHVKIVSVIAQ